MTIMQYPDASYFDRPVGEQLLSHFARRDAVRHTTPLLPFRFADVLALFRGTNAHRKTV
ncbi:hypothetical protein ACUXAV_002403 [Cupriavidus metallidurans]|jgi:hypothetical protein|nr:MULTISPECIES: hypothetical protein [Cupriavidus]MDE4921414.1 hypothetical protein [Cupriavidus metallidurans]QWC92675.1 hypothetical protein KB891_28485 [Cupriavidus metallidurans]UBM08927.1 hypothetical protein LAI70_03240 [Cupriavidus metallidurans]GMG92573.1 hypothetical protein Cmtc_37930 [Cupriavidus sp. TKC]